MAQQRGRKTTHTTTSSRASLTRGARGRGHGTTTVHRTGPRGTMSTANALTGMRASGSTQQSGSASGTTSGIAAGAGQPRRSSASSRTAPTVSTRRGPEAGRPSTGLTASGRPGESPVRRDVRRSQHQPTAPIGPSGRPAREDGLLQANQLDRGTASRGETSASKHERSDQNGSRSTPQDSDPAMSDAFDGIAEDAFEVDNSGE